MDAMASLITSLTIVYSFVYSEVDQRKHQAVRHRTCAGNSPVTGEFPAQRASNTENVCIWWRYHEQDGRAIATTPVNSPHKWPVTRKMFPFDDVNMCDVQNPR